VIIVFPVFGQVDPFRRYSRSKSEVSEIAPNFACFWPPISLGGGLPEFLDLYYKADPDCVHVPQFHGDRRWELGGSMANIREKRQA